MSFMVWVATIARATPSRCPPRRLGRLRLSEATAAQKATVEGHGALCGCCVQQLRSVRSRLGAVMCAHQLSLTSC